MVLIVATTVLSFSLGVIDLKHIALIWPRVWGKFEIWRLITNFFIVAKPSFKFLIYLMWVVTYMFPLEKETFQFEPADFVYMLTFNAVCINLASLWLGLYFNGVPLILSCVYVWSKNFGEGNVSLYGLVTVKAFYLPFAFAAMSLLLGDSVMPDLEGIAVGHLYYFFKELYPRTSGRNLLQTPDWLKRKVADWGLGRPPVTGPDAAASARDAGFRAFRGQGQRLGIQ